MNTGLSYRTGREWGRSTRERNITDRLRADAERDLAKQIKNEPNFQLTRAYSLGVARALRD